MTAAEAQPEAFVVPPDVLAVEARRNRVVGALAVASVLANFASLVVLVGSQTAGPSDQRDLRAIRDADHKSGTLLSAMGLRVLALVLVVIVGVYLVQLIAHRERVPRAMWIFAFAGPVLVAAGAVVSQLLLIHAGHTFAHGGVQTEARADHLLNHGSGQIFSNLLAIFAAVVFAVWLGWTSLAASRVGLMTKFLGYFGAGGALASAIVPVAGQGLVIGWLGSVGILMLGWWPGGRGPSWTTGVVAPWDAGAQDKKPRGRLT